MSSTAVTDDPTAHALYDRILDTMREAETLSWQSQYRWEAEGREIGHCTYGIWMKKPNCARMEATVEGKLRGVLVLDGDHFWIYWPNGRPAYGFEDDSEYEKTRFTSYMKEAAPQGRHSIAHQTNKLGCGMGMTIIQPSVFHGGGSSLDRYVDGVVGMGAEAVGDEECDAIEVSFMNHQRSKYLWLSKCDHLPRKLREVVRVHHDIIAEELWSHVAVNSCVPDDMFVWRPPEGWHEWRLPSIEEGLLKPGTEAPDFDLPATDGSGIRLSDYRGKVVWLCFWRVGCPPCREEIPQLEELHKELGAKGLVVLGINTADDKKIASDFLREHGATFPNIVDSSDAARKTNFEDYQTLKGFAAVPLNYIIDREGRVVEGFYGYERERGPETLKRLGLK